MPLNSDTNGKFSAVAAVLCAFTLVAIVTPSAVAQTKTDEAKQEGTVLSMAKPGMAPVPQSVETFFLANASEQNQLNDIQTDMRNILPRARIYGVASQVAITVEGSAEDLETARKLIADLDRPRKVYRLTYSVTDIDDGKRSGPRHYILLAASGQRTIFKLGDRVPIMIGSNTKGTEVQYADVGLSIDATVAGSPDGLNVRSKIEQSNVAVEKAIAGSQDPVIRQTVLEATVEVAQGKPLVLGSLDFPESQRREEIEVAVEVVK